MSIKVALRTFLIQRGWVKCRRHISVECIQLYNWLGISLPFRCIKSDTNRLLNSFYSHVIRLLNSKQNGYTEYLSWPLYFILILHSMLTHRAIHTTHTDTPSHIETVIWSHTHNMQIHLYWLTLTHMQSSYMLLLCWSFILIPSRFTPIHIYLYPSSIPAHCKYGTKTNPVYSMLTYFIMFFLFLYLVCLYSTLLFLVLYCYWLLQRHFTVLEHVTLKHDIVGLWIPQKHTLIR
jgi:hypothetical protein